MPLDTASFFAILRTGMTTFPRSSLWSMRPQQRLKHLDPSSSPLIMERSHSHGQIPEPAFAYAPSGAELSILNRASRRTTSQPTASGTNRNDFVPKWNDPSFHPAAPSSAGILACCNAIFQTCTLAPTNDVRWWIPTTEHLKHETENSSLRLSTLNRGSSRTTLTSKLHSALFEKYQPPQVVDLQPLSRCVKAGQASQKTVLSNLDVKARESNLIENRTRRVRFSSLAWNKSERFRSKTERSLVPLPELSTQNDSHLSTPTSAVRTPSRGGLFPARPPLRTVLESFPSYGSSRSNRWPCSVHRRQFHNEGEILQVTPEWLVAFWAPFPPRRTRQAKQRRFLKYSV
jgi:hypothetical protein